VLGHVQRGGTPVPVDRVLASQFGHYAVELLASGHSNRMVVFKEGRLGDIPILDVANRQRLVPLDHHLIQVARAVKTCFGDEPVAQTFAVREA
jgi:6-phosphofructokinase 1